MVMYFLSNFYINQLKFNNYFKFSYSLLILWLFLCDIIKFKNKNYFFVLFFKGNFIREINTDKFGIQNIRLIKLDIKSIGFTRLCQILEKLVR